MRADWHHRRLRRRRRTVTPVRVLHLCEVATLRVPFDIVYVVLKAYDTRWGVELIQPLVAATAS